MIKKFFLAIVMLVGIYGCATPSGLFNTEHPGRMSWAGGEVQLLFSNPEYTDLSDQFEREQYKQQQVFGKKGNYPFVNGGIGAMGVWRF